MPIIEGTNLYILIALSFIDTILTYEWAKVCLKRKPDLKVKQVESNPFICVCWNNYGLGKGSIISGAVLMIVQILLSSIHKYIFYIVGAILVFAIYNHSNNFLLLKKGRIFKDPKNNDKEVNK